MIILLATFLLSVLLCGLYLRLAHRWHILDEPNARSSHAQPTPHGGGVPLLLAFAAGFVANAWLADAWSREYYVLMLTAVILMLVGVVDDMRGLSVRLRFCAYGICCAGVAAFLLWPVFPQPGWLALLVVFIVSLTLLWSLNLYNFMDGIDGLAALQCINACAAAALLAWLGGEGAYALFCLLLAASHLGFFCWNCPPAKLFMGDAGSIPTGFLLAGLALMGQVSGALQAAVWLILLAPFITDATWTLLWRLFTGQAFMQAHRLHAYQRLSRLWQSHLAVDLLLLAISGLWLFPLAWAAHVYPQTAFLLVILAYVPLLAGMVKIRQLT